VKSFLITNKAGGYALFSDKPFSRYSGVFFSDGVRVYKVIEDIHLNKKTTNIVNNLWSVERKRGDVKESFFMPFNHNALVYETEDNVEIDISLDVREPYDNREYGRYYHIYEDGDNIVVQFTKRMDSKEDSSNGKEEYVCYIVIRPEHLDYEIIEEWEKRDYELDRERNSYPFERYVYKAVRLHTSKVVFCFGKDEEKAIQEAKFVLKNLERLKEEQRKYITNLVNKKRIKEREIFCVYRSAVNSLEQLTVNIDGEVGVYSGLPWFFQFWVRDEAVSLKALMLLKKYPEVKSVILRHLNNISYDGNIKNTFIDKIFISADAIGWTSQRIQDFMRILRKGKKLNRYLDKEDIGRIAKKLEKAVENLLSYSTREGLAYNREHESWMDTSYGEDKRAGFRIEIQALRLRLYNLVYELTNNKKYKTLEEELKRKVRERFWNGEYLADGLDDWTARPNIFITAYIYPELLTKKEWIKCFQHALPKLWCKWGGLTSIDKRHTLFCSSHTGEDNRSYHRGDSWFWVNNLAALVMYRTNKKLFRKYIDKILEASTKEILDKGAIGHHAEVSSAEKLMSQGCFAQAWSNAMYIELVEEMF
jgi:glycogen debranching enzyme